MNLENIPGYTIKNLGKINVLLGKNGSGKSTLLRGVEAGCSGNVVDFGKAKYITPERGGVLVYEAGVEQNLLVNTGWLRDQRNSNQAAQFRQQSMAQFRRLRELVLEEIEQDSTKRQNFEYKFDKIYVGKINSLLDQVEIKRVKKQGTFRIYRKGTEDEIVHNAISSGESELISLGIECLIFSKECEQGKENLLCLDEPDVHLHPDLQVRLLNFLREIVEEYGFRVLIATHSTAILGALASYEHTQIAFMKAGQIEIQFRPISGIYSKILPVFGAHPLSNLFNEAPPLIVEGEDDERIWQQAVRTSKGRIRIYPCVCEGVGDMSDFERETQSIITSVYDNAKAYSLRDRDDNPVQEIEDLPPLIRFKLSCREAENLLLTNEVLASLGLSWDELLQGIELWIQKNSNPPHTHFEVIRGFKDNGYPRKTFNLKEVPNTMMGIIGSKKPWEVAVGQVIGSLSWNQKTDFDIEGSILEFLGKKLVLHIIPQQKQ